MSKKHFIAAAKELRNRRSSFEKRHGELAFNEMVDLVADLFKSANVRFDYARFRDAVFEPFQKAN